MKKQQLTLNLVINQVIKKINLFSCSLIILYCLSQSVFLKADVPCSFTCSTSNVTVVDSYIAHESDCSPIESCDIGETVDAAVGFVLDWNTAQTRYCVRIWATLIIEDAEGNENSFVLDGVLLAQEVNPSGSSNTTVVCGYPFTYECGSNITLTAHPDYLADPDYDNDGPIFSWTTNDDDTCDGVDKDGGCTPPGQSACKPETVLTAPLTANFTYTAACVGSNAVQTITFTNTTIGGTPTITYSWAFGDGNTSIDESPVHTYAAAGTYNVTLTAEDSEGETSTTIKNVLVESCCDFGSPTCNLDATPQEREGCDASDADAAETDYNNVFTNIPTQPCGDLTMTHSDETSGTLCPDGITVTRTYTLFDDLDGDDVLDGGEESVTCVEVFLINDTTAPELIGTLPSGQTGIDGCKADAPDGPNEADIKALYEDDCDTDLSVTKSGSPTGDDCSWSVTYEYTITDDCGNEVSPKPSVTYSGGDNSAASLKAGSTFPSGQTGIDDCISKVPAGPTTAAIKALYEDDCDTDLSVTKSGSPTGDDCSWSVTYEYTITDDCGNEVSPKPSVTYSGGDNSAASLKAGSTFPSGQTGIDDCISKVPAGPTTAAIKALYEDDCDTDLSVTKSGSPTGDDCSWSVTYEYTITDDCGNEVSPKPSVTYSGGDNSAASLKAGSTFPSGQTGIDDCISKVPAGPTTAAIKALYEDDCDTDLSVTKSGSPTGDDCSWSVTYEYTITDDCGNEVSPKPSVTYSGGDNSAASLKAGSTFPSGQTGIDDCISKVPAGPTTAAIKALYEDDCDTDLSVTKSGSPTGDDCSWSVTYEYTITDDCGNEVSPKPSVTYSGGSNTPPTFTNCPADAGSLENPVSCIDIPEVPTVTATDHCSGATITATYDGETYTECEDGIYEITRIWTATDACDNEAECSQTIYVTTLIETPCFTIQLNITENADGSTTYAWLVTSKDKKKCRALSHIAFELPLDENGNCIAAINPYAQNGNYNIVNPASNPFGCSIKFESIGEGIKGGEGEVFYYTLPADAPELNPIRIQIKAGKQIDIIEFDVERCVCPEPEPNPKRDISAEDIRDFILYPNPAAGNSLITLNLDNYIGETLLVKVYDIAGRLIYQSPDMSITVNDSHISLNHTFSNAGMYIVVVQTEEGLNGQKLIITK